MNKGVIILYHIFLNFDEGQYCMITKKTHVIPFIFQVQKAIFYKTYSITPEIKRLIFTRSPIDATVIIMIWINVGKYHDKMRLVTLHGLSLSIHYYPRDNGSYFLEK